MIHSDKIFKSTKSPSQWAKAVFVIGWLENRHETNAQQLAVREGVSLTRLPWTLFFQTVLHLLLSFSVEKDIYCSRIKTLTSKLCTFCLKIKEEDWLQWLWLFDSHLTSTVHLWRHLKKWKKPSIPDITRSSLEHCQITLNNMAYHVESTPELPGLLLHPSSGVQLTYGISAKAHWSCSSDTCWPNTSLRQFELIFFSFFICIHARLMWAAGDVSTCACVNRQTAVCGCTWELTILWEDLAMLAGRPKNAGLSSSGRFSITLR